MVKTTAGMVRLIKRYGGGSRKLYDTEESRYVSLDQLCLSPQCGFSSTVDGNALSQDEQRAKLELVVEVADDVWGR